MKKLKVFMYSVMMLLIMSVVTFAGTTEAKAASKSVTVKGKTISLGTTVKALDKKLGKYKASYSEPTGLKAYVYNKTSGRFVIAYTKGSKVVGFFILGKSYKTPYAKSGMKQADLKKKGFKADSWWSVKSESGYVNNTYAGFERVGSQVDEQEFIDYWGNKKTYAAKVYLSKYSVYFNDWGVEKKNSSKIRTGLEKETYYVTNAFRDYMGVKKLSYSDKVAKVARAHSADMASNNYFDHYSLDGRSPFDRMRNGGINYAWAGENIAAGQNCGVNFVLAWVCSQGHRNNMKHKEFKYLGVGYASKSSSTYGTYCTQNFYSLR